MLLAKELFERGDCQGARAILEGALTNTPDDAGLIALYRVVLSSVRAQYLAEKKQKGPIVENEARKVTDSWAPADRKRKITDKWNVEGVDAARANG